MINRLGFNPIIIKKIRYCFVSIQDLYGSMPNITNTYSTSFILRFSFKSRITKKEQEKKIPITKFLTIPI